MSLYIVATPAAASELVAELSDLGLVGTPFGACPEQDALEIDGLEYCTVECSPEVAAHFEDHIGDVLVWPAGDRDAMCEQTGGVLR